MREEEKREGTYLLVGYDVGGGGAWLAASCISRYYWEFPSRCLLVFLQAKSVQLLVLFTITFSIS
jgi:hypothetical protein